MIPVTWLDVVKKQLKANPGKSVKDIIPEARKEWNDIKNGNHSNKAHVKKVSEISDDKKSRGKKSHGKKNHGKKSRGKKSRGKKSRGKKRRTMKRHSKKRKGGGGGNSMCYGVSSL